uniref:DUF4435 domain-containing protein n=1 Tax=Candidatus Kentrum sp. TUN TaxID=2126343 RepID=A0A450Z974_9GAMM|nr:MAG: Protein of unknown function (DUF4435) [Candidatus Kentron sp. TUN]VFK51530.1 MAG: Protein of unknown function (DUF4435) [Candidatus Kentron sp. TUN]VFK55992.1 MAG: Protein of unknown function (DUF4435) [Candidatus Kentron sp. TUN]
MNMRKHLNWTDIANEIRLELKNKYSTNKIWVIVEGIPDQRLFSNLIDGNQVEVYFSYSGLNGVLEIVSELSEETNHILGIRDADFLHLEGKTEIPENIFLTDYHDIEMMMISCDEVYRGVESQHLTRKKEDEDSAGHGKFVFPHKALSSRKIILNAISFMGGLRWINNTENLGLNFDDLGLGKFYDWNVHENIPVIQEDKYLNMIMQRSDSKKGRVSREEINLKRKNMSDLLNLCNGHDFLKVFAISASHSSKKGMNEDDIGKAFGSAYRFEDFQKTNLYKKLQEWSNSRSLPLFEQA